MSIEIEESQSNFLRNGGMFQMPLAKMRKEGQIPRDYVFHEYPKAITITKGPPRKVERSTEAIRGNQVTIQTWVEEVVDEETIIVSSEEEEERVLSGGMTTQALEEQRQGLLQRCRTMGILADPTWSAVRLRRELGDALDAPAPGDNMAKLEAELAQLKKMAAMQAEIDALRAQMAGKPAEDADELRGELRALGVEVDMRWSVKTLRQKLDEATAPGQAA